MSQDGDIEGRYALTVEAMARRLAFGDDPAGRKWHFQGGMLRTVNDWWLRSLPLAVIFGGMQRALHERKVQSPIAPLFLHYLTLDRHVGQVHTEQGLTRLSLADIPAEAEIDTYVEGLIEAGRARELRRQKEAAEYQNRLEELKRKEEAITALRDQRLEELLADLDAGDISSKQFAEQYDRLVRGQEP